MWCLQEGSWRQLNFLRLAKNSLTCRHFQLGLVGRNRKPDHNDGGAVIRLKTRSN